MKVCVVIPVHNEAKAIGHLVKGIKEKSLDAIVIDDGSQDQSGILAQKEGAIVLTNEERQGKGRSLQRGFDQILKSDYWGVITMDGDGQHSVADLDIFLQRIQENPRCIITGNRMNDIKNMPLIRNLTNRFMSGLISLLCRQSIPDSQCGFRYIPKELLTQIRLTSHDFEIESEVLIKASKRGLKILSVPVQTIYRDEKSKVNPFLDTIRFIIYIFRETFSKAK